MQSNPQKLDHHHLAFGGYFMVCVLAAPTAVLILRLQEALHCDRRPERRRFRRVHQ